MNICFMCDLHLPFDRDALQYKALEWAIEDIRKKTPDCIVFAGDITCDGNIEVYRWFITRMQEINIPFLFIPGNSDLRCQESGLKIHKMASGCKNDINGTLIFAVNDSDNTISDEEFRVLEEANDSSIVFMHHPPKQHWNENYDKLMKWRTEHKQTMMFFGHCHKSEINNADISLQAMDPDKAIGENPCITYYNTDSKEIRKAYYFSTVPTDLYTYFGVSCYGVEENIKFAVENNLKNIELRPNCLGMEKATLIEIIGKWRKAGGENLSMHLPDIRYKDGMPIPDKRFDEYVALIKLLKVDRVTQHVPQVSLKTVKEDKFSLEKISEYLAEKLNIVEHKLVIGVENMHMTSNEEANDSRRFGYIPEECIKFMQLLASKCKHEVGINFDIGHARNNAPYSQKYQISTWFSMIGKYIVGYHIHQVTEDNGIFESHMPITEIYGRLISYGSFFKCWTEGQIQKAPVIFEMRPEYAYRITLETFNNYRKKTVFDIHSHARYSYCGRDNPHDLINTAIRNGLSIFGISDHNYGIGNRKVEYIQEIQSLAAEYKGKIKILCGIEIATLPQSYDLKSTEEIKEFDYCLIEHITDSESIVGGNLFEFCKKLGILCGIAHTDLFEYCDMYGYDYSEFFKKMAENKIFWEMNVSFDSIHKYKEHSYVHDFMIDEQKIKLIKDSGVYISIGFDSHRLEDYDGFKVHQMYDFLKNNNINTIDDVFRE